MNKLYVFLLSLTFSTMSIGCKKDTDILIPTPPDVSQPDGPATPQPNQQTATCTPVGIPDGVVITATIGPTGGRITESLSQPALVNSYFEGFGNEKVENVTRWQQASVASMQGDYGLIATPLDYIRFMQILIEGRQVPPALLQRITTWVDGSDAKPIYGMGLSYVTHQEQSGYVHGRAGIGAVSTLYFFPKKQVYVFISVNIGTLTGGPTAHLAEAMQEELLDELLT